MESNHREAADLKTLIVKGETAGSEDGSDDVEIVGNRRVARILDAIARVEICEAGGGKINKYKQTKQQTTKHDAAVPDKGKTEGKKVEETCLLLLLHVLPARLGVTSTTKGRRCGERDGEKTRIRTSSSEEAS